MLSIESPESLSSWLTRELAPICDADPGALAKYVLALLKKPDKSFDEIKEVCMLQLEVFLQTNTKRFVDKLFTALTEKSYIEAPADPPAQAEATPAPAPSAAVAAEEKRERKEERREKEKKKEAPKEKPVEERKEKSKEKEPSPPHSASASQSSSSISTDRPRRIPSSTPSAPKREAPSSSSDSAVPSTSSTRRSPIRAPRKRVSPPPEVKRRRSRSPPVRGNRRVGARRSPVREKRRSRSRSPIEKERRRGDRDREEEKERKKKRCRDFDEQGVCVRGDACPFDHGLDPVVVENAALAAMGLKAGVGSVGPSAYSVPPPGYNPMPTNPPPPGVDNVGYNPEAPGLGGMGDFSVPPPPLPVAGGWRQAANTYGVIPNQVGYEPSGSIPVDPHSGGMLGGMGGGMMRGRGRGRGRGGFHPYARGGGQGGEEGVQKEGALASAVAARTLIVKKIPAEQNNISKLNEHFEQFGSITNMQVHYEGAPDTALITFSSRFEATRAYKNPEPIFNNRFIRVFWYANVTDGPNKMTLSSGVTVETPETASAPPPAPREPVVLPGPGQTKYRKPEAVEAFKKKQEAAAARKVDKESLLRQKDLLRRTTRILCGLQDQQKQVIMAMMKETDADKKKALHKMMKQLDGKIGEQKTAVEEQQEKLKSVEARLEKNTGEVGGEEGESSGDEAPVESPEGVNVKVEEEHEDDHLSAQVDEEFAAFKQEMVE